MSALFNCELFYVDSPHLHQVYDGFQKLRKNGVINFTINRNSEGIGGYRKPLLTVIIDNKYKIIYDTLDGLNWFDGAEEDNLEYFRDSISADFYFKRSYKEILREYAPNGCRIYPLGFNYRLKPQGKLPYTFKQRIKDVLQETPGLSGFLGNKKFNSRFFEYYPIHNEELKILFLARLWDPNEVDDGFFAEARQRLNSNRIECIRACRKEFNDSFLGGLQNSEYAREIASDLIMPDSVTNKETYLKVVKNHDICIATTGLLGSIGGKFGEYIAASRAIVTEPLRYQVPGEYTEGKNYLSFNYSDQLIRHIYSLLNDRQYLSQMMLNNFRYYNNFLKPDSLVLNTLLKVKAATQ